MHAFDRFCGVLSVLILLSACGESTPQDLGPLQVSVTTETLPDGDVGVGYSVALQASGGSGTYSWRLADGRLPSGLSFDEASATISGIPIAGESSTFTVEASDPAAQATRGSRELSLLVYSTPEVIATPPGGVVGEAYSYAMQAEGGRGSYTWSITAGALPPGITMTSTGSLAGSPTAAGSWMFTVRLTSGPVSADMEVGVSVCETASGTDPFAGVEPWRGYQREGAQTGYVPVTLEPCRFAHAWTVETEGSDTYASQVVTESGVAVVSELGSSLFRGGKVIGLDVDNGTELWREDVDYPGHPGINAGVTYVTNDIQRDAVLLALDANSGASVFQTPFQNQTSRQLAPIVVDGFVVAGATLYSGVQVYEEATGDSVWAAGTGSTPYSWAGPAATDSAVYVMGNTGLHSMDLRTGATLGFITGPCNCEGTFPTVLTSPDRAVASVIGKLTSFDLKGDSIAWVRTVSSTSFASADGLIFVATNDAVEVVDEATGALVRSWEPPHDAVGGGTRFLVTDNLLFMVFVGQVHAVDLDTWEEVWHYPVEGEISLSEGKLFIHTTRGEVVAISMH